MIVFDKLWKLMSQKGVSTYTLREKYGRLKNNKNTETKTLNKLCAALNCKLEDIAEYVELEDEQDIY